jgi:hypothetical protein
MSDYVGISPVGPNGETFGCWMLGMHGQGVYCTPKGEVSGTWKVGGSGQLVLEPAPDFDSGDVLAGPGDADYLDVMGLVLRSVEDRAAADWRCVHD